ncbi:hypothetical protein DVH24_035042 [Malus domestica]|uniref:Dof-type domain-containing protein n=1 Tax=Malus domestica TaxID=3750 RepID=A0A498IJG6_MALDO|nr:hypothetical protein DVH24_035042 [Malus domestica]
MVLSTRRGGVGAGCCSDGVGKKINKRRRRTIVLDQEKGFKKPDKFLPCPRCGSLDTEFCYSNNYNVNQPRQYWKNCQRY